MGLNEEITIAGSVLVVLVLLFGYVLKLISKAFSRFFSRMERKLNDAAVYISHINEDKNHLDAILRNKIDRKWAEEHLSAAAREFGAKEHAKSKVRLVISAK